MTRRPFDAIDNRLLRLLHQNQNIGLSELAAAAGTSRLDVLHRVCCYRQWGLIEEEALTMLAKCGESLAAMVPPPETVLPGTFGTDLVDFLSEGAKHMNLFVQLCDIRPSARVLDVGCGCGRMAVPLTQYLSPAGSYAGFDLRDDGVESCLSRINPRFPNFSFQTVDVSNRHYRPNGSQRAANFRFPYADATFDAVVLISVLTHLIPEDLEAYLRESARVTNSGGCVFATVFLLDDATTHLISAGRARSDLQFPHDHGAFRALDEKVPERGVAYDEASIRERYASVNLTVVEPIVYGSWRDWKSRGQDPESSVQDIIVARRGE